MLLLSFGRPKLSLLFNGRWLNQVSTWWVGLVVMIGLGGLTPQVQAKTTGEYLFRVQRPVANDRTTPGREMAGLPGVRLITRLDQQLRLNIRERASLQRNIVYRSMFTPNDPQFSLQWNLQAMNVPAAWEVDQIAPFYGGDPRIVVAVLDTGLASTVLGGAQSVPDIALGTVWTNIGEVAGDGIDNDGDGYVDDIHGWDFFNGTASPYDDNGHGTHVSGAIAAGTNNNIATAGIAGNVTIMPLKVLDDEGLGSTATLTAAVNYAVNHGANIINLSLGGDEDDPVFHQAIQAALNQGIVVVAAAGNSGASTVTYPARYPNVIGVGATNTDGTRASYSNYGSNLTIVAPAGDTNVDLNADGQPDGVPSQTCSSSSCATFSTVYFSGTSQAASEVSAVIALLESCGATPGNIVSLLTTSAHDLGAVGRDDQFGHGQVDASAALTAAGCVTTAPAAPSAITGSASGSVTTPIRAKRPSPYTAPVFSWSGPTGATYTVTWKKGTTVVSQAKQSSTTFSPTITDEATYTLSISTVDALGQSSASTSFIYQYKPPVVALSSGGTVRLLTSTLKSLRSFIPAVKSSALTIAGGPLTKSGTSRLAIGAQSKSSTINIVDTKGKLVSSLTPFGSKFSGRISAAVLTLVDGTSQFVAATTTNGANLTWYSASGKQLGRTTVYRQYAKGLNLAAGDINGDGNDELIVAQAAGSEIRIYDSGRKLLGTLTPRGKKFTQGWSVTIGDLTGDGTGEIIITPNISTKIAKVLVLDGSGGELNHWNMTGSTTAPMLLQALDMDGDGRSEILAAPLRGAGSLQQRSATGKLIKQVTLSTADYRSLTRL